MLSLLQFAVTLRVCMWLRRQLRSVAGAYYADADFTPPGDLTRPTARQVFGSSASKNTTLNFHSHE